MAPDDMFTSSSRQNIPDSQGTMVSGVNLFSQCSVNAGKVLPGSELQGSSIPDQLEIQRTSSQEVQEDHFPHLRVSEQSPAPHTGATALLQGTFEIQRACSQEIQEEVQDVSEDIPLSRQPPVATEAEEDEVSK